MNCKLQRNLEFLLKRASVSLFFSAISSPTFSINILLAFHMSCYNSAAKRRRSSFATRLSISTFHLTAIKPPPSISPENPPRVRFFTIAVNRSAKAKTGRFGSINRPLDPRRFIANR